MYIIVDWNHWSCESYILLNIFILGYTGYTQKNGAVPLYSPLKPHHSFVCTLYKSSFINRIKHNSFAEFQQLRQAVAFFSRQNGSQSIKYCRTSYKKVKIIFCTMLWDMRKSIYFFKKVPRFYPVARRCWWIWSNGGMILRGEAEVLGSRNGAVAPCPPQFFHGPVRYQTMDSALKGSNLKRLLTTWLSCSLPRTLERTQILPNSLLTLANMYGRHGCWTAVLILWWFMEVIRILLAGFCEKR